MANRDKRSRNWMGVVYNYDDPTHHHGMSGFTNFAELLKVKLVDGDIVGNQIAFYIHGDEVCPTTGTKHLQCFFIFKAVQSLAALRTNFTRWLGFECTIAWKMADQNQEACIEYCSKDKTNIQQFGKGPKGKGHRTDLDSVVAVIEQSGNLADVARLCPTQFIKFNGGIAKLIALRLPPRDFKTEVYWLHGETGTGKSRWAMEQVDRSDVYLKNGENKWWDGYCGQKDVIIDDFRPNKELNFNYLLNLLGNLPMIVEMKGASAQFTSERVFITAPLPPRDLYANCEWIKDENLQQLERRINSTIHFTATQFTLGYANLPPPSVPTANTWLNHTTRPKPIISLPSSSKAKTNQNTPTVPLENAGTVNMLEPLVQVIPVLDPVISDQSDSDSDMGSIDEISGDEEPADGEDLYDEERSVETEPLSSDNEFLASEYDSDYSN